MIKQISSIHNPIMKQWLALKEKSRSRKRLGLFLIEGLREISLCIKGGYSIETLIFNPDLISIDDLRKLNISNAEIVEVTLELYQRLAYRESTQGIIAVSRSKQLSLDQLELKNPEPLFLVAEAPEKPGNLGALLRTADAANLDAVIIANPITDLYNPNVIRSSVGCVFTNQIAIGNTEEVIQYLKSKKFKIFCAALDKSENYHTQDYTQATAIVVGTEATGLTAAWLENATQNIMIPMQGEIDSLNVSVAAGILIFEAKRQRDFA
jgi:TrmH family RNA methyltransferase